MKTCGLHSTASQTLLLFRFGAKSCAGVRAHKDGKVVASEMSSVEVERQLPQAAGLCHDDPTRHARRQQRVCVAVVCLKLEHLHTPAYQTLL